MTLLFAAGALAVMAQVVILRELVAALFGVELLYVLALGSWLAGTAAGSAAGRWVPASSAVGRAGCVMLGILVPAELILIRTAGPTTGAIAGAYLPFPAQLGWIAAATLPPAAACGVLFPVLAGLARVTAVGLGRSYAVESAGAAVGGAAVTLAVWMGASTLQVALAAPAVAVLAAAATARRPARAFAVVGPAIAAAAAAAALYAPAWDLALLRSTYPALAGAVDTPYARVVITRTGSQYAVFENGALAFDTEGTGAEAFADLAAVQHPHPRRALVIGGGAEGVPAALGRHGIALIHNLEIDVRAYDLARRLTSVPPAAVIVGEPRRFLERAEPYDLILVAAGEPTSGASSRFYTTGVLRAVRPAAHARRCGRHPPGLGGERVARPARAAHGKHRCRDAARIQFDRVPGRSDALRLRVDESPHLRPCGAVGPAARPRPPAAPDYAAVPGVPLHQRPARRGRTAAPGDTRRRAES